MSATHPAPTVGGPAVPAKPRVSHSEPGEHRSLYVGPPGWRLLHTTAEVEREVDVPEADVIGAVVDAAAGVKRQV